MRQVPIGLDSLLRRERLRVVDVGARGGWPRKWQVLRPWVTLIGFEPEAEECERLRTSAAEDEIYIAEALYRTKSEVLLYHTRDPHCSSLYRPNQRIIRRLRPEDDRMDVLRSEPISATTLDSALDSAGLPSVDFIKLDTQGSELDILCGGTRTLERRVIGVEVEVEFLPLYEDQPLFPHVHQFLLDHGFVLMGFPHTCSVADFRAAVRPHSSTFVSKAMSRWAAAMTAPNGSLRGAKQLLYGDAIYLRDVDRLLESMARDDVDADLLATRAVAVCCATSYYDHALGIVEAAHRHGLIGDELRKDLLVLTQALSRSVPQLVSDLKRLAGRLRHRLRHLGE